MTKVNQSIILGGGCFWCLDAVYRELEGVEDVVPGYSGGTTPNPSYDAVCSGSTGHVEVVRVMYNPQVISVETILAVFWSIHDPTSLNKQGADIGSQYASVIFYSSDEQRDDAIRSRNVAQKQIKDPIVTRLEKLDVFHEAEDYHRDYYANNPEAGYCQVVIDPKLQKLRQYFSDYLKK